MEDSYREMWQHVIRIVMLSFFMVIPLPLSNTAIAESHLGGAGGRSIYDPANAGASQGTDPCSPFSNAANIADPSFNTPISAPAKFVPPVPPASAATPATTPAPPAPAAAAKPEGSKSTAASAEDAKAAQAATAKAEPAKEKSSASTSSEEKEPANASTDALARGKAVFAKADCTGCHDGQTYSIEKQITAVRAGTMPKGGGLTASERADLVAYLESTK